MNSLFIQVANGVPINYPAYESNLLAAFGKVPSDWVPFVRVEQPALGLYQLLIRPTPTYEYDGGVFTDRWHVREMSTVERVAKDKAIAAEELLTRDQGIKNG